MAHPSKACVQAWPRLAKTLGENPETPAQSLRPNGSVVRFGRVVLKHISRDLDQALRAQDAAEFSLACDPVNRVAPLLGVDRERNVLAVAHAPGQDFVSLARDGHAPEELCALIGRWARAFHAVPDPENRPLKTGTPLRNVPLQSVYLKDDFARMRETLVDLAHQVADCPTPHAQLHGDLHLENLVYDGTLVTGFDFENTGLHPAARDLGQILADLHVETLTPPDCVLPPAWRNALESTYGEIGPTLDFFVHQRLLMKWAKWPGNIWTMSQTKLAQALALRQIVQA